jgi:hypothetical protein
MLAVAFLTAVTGCKEPKPPESADADAVPVELERVKAEAGVGKQGQIIGDKEGFLRTPVKAYFSARQQIQFLKVQQALNLYEAEHGFKPKSHEEFMSKIIEFNLIELPELPAGQSYIWDPERGELLVERPQQSTTAADG